MSTDSLDLSAASGASDSESEPFRPSQKPENFATNLLSLEGDEVVAEPDRGEGIFQN